MSRGFCETCGSPLLIRKPEVPQLTFLQVGSLDDPSQFVPAAEVYTCRAQAVSKPVDGASRYEKGPPADLVRSAVAAHFANRE